MPGLSGLSITPRSSAPVDPLMASGVEERPLDGDAVELPVDPLVEAAHPLIGDSLSCDRIPNP